jgi:hypothetical protein
MRGRSRFGVGAVGLRGSPARDLQGSSAQVDVRDGDGLDWCPMAPVGWAGRSSTLVGSLRRWWSGWRWLEACGPREGACGRKGTGSSGSVRWSLQLVNGSRRSSVSRRARGAVGQSVGGGHGGGFSWCHCYARH